MVKIYNNAYSFIFWHYRIDVNDHDALVPTHTITIINIKF